jgi:hypothetical protein
MWWAGIARQPPLLPSLYEDALTCYAHQAHFHLLQLGNELQGLFHNFLNQVQPQFYDGVQLVLVEVQGGHLGGRMVAYPRATRAVLRAVGKPFQPVLRQRSARSGTARRWATWRARRPPGGAQPDFGNK